LVEVDVVVRDKKGPVQGLTKADFTLQDDGKKQTIELFSVTVARGDNAAQGKASPGALELPPFLRVHPRMGGERRPRQQRFGKYTRSLMKGLGVPVENRFGLRPAVLPGTNQLAPVTAMRDLDLRGWLNGVTTFNFHQHLPHYEVTTTDINAIRVLAGTSGKCETPAEGVAGKREQIK
jgi:hypothetical protein